MQIADVTLVSDDHIEFKAHKIVLAPTVMYFGDGNLYRMEAFINAAKSLEVKEICDGVE